MNDERLRSELDALERSAPADLPPRPSIERRRSRWLVPAMFMVLAGLLIGVSAPVWLGAVRPVASTGPTAPGTPSGSAAPSAGPTTSGLLTWHVVAFPDDGALLISITNVEGRLILTGALGGRPMAWYSDDAGFSWRRSTVASGPPIATLVPASYLMGELAGTAESLVAIGSVSTGGNDAAAVPVVWHSTDGGASWDPATTGGYVSFAASPMNRVLWDGTQFLALEETAPGSYDGPNWSSTNGMTWQPMSPPSHARPTTPIASVALGSQRAMLVVTDLSPAPEIWAADTDGYQGPVQADGGPLEAEAITVGTEGFVAVSPGVATSSERELLTGIGAVWGHRPFRLKIPAGAGDVLVDAVSDMALGTLITGYAGTERLAWFLAPGADEASLVDVGIGASVALRASFVAVGDCGPTADCATYLAYGLQKEIAPPALSVGPAPTP